MERRPLSGSQRPQPPHGWEDTGDVGGSSFFFLAKVSYSLSL